MTKVLNNPKLTTNFTLKEFKCKCGCQQTVINMQGVKLLQKIRDHFKKPVTIVSPFRCEKHNTNVGGKSNSYHLCKSEEETAYDIVVKRIHPLEVAKYADLIGFNGIGVYTHNDNWFTHIDTRSLGKCYWVDMANSKNLKYLVKLPDKE